MHGLQGTVTSCNRRMIMNIIEKSHIMGVGATSTDAPTGLLAPKRRTKPKLPTEQRAWAEVSNPHVTTLAGQ